MTNEARIQSILEHKRNGEVLFMTMEGAMVAKIEKLVEQPPEGLLYDLNRDFATLSTNAKNSKNLKWVNDMALANIVEYLMNENKKLINEIKKIKKELEDAKIECGNLAKDPFFYSKHEYNTTPIPTASKPSVEKTNQNAGKILPGFNDQLNIAL